MESNNQKPIIVEFNGLPGTGKSTISEELEKLAEIKGLKVYRSFDNPGSSLLSPLLKIRNYAILPSLLFLGKKEDMSRDRLGQILRCLRYIDDYINFTKLSNNSAILLLDEGIIQALVSIAYLESFKGKEEKLKLFFSKLMKYNVQWYSVNCISEPSISFERVIQRGAQQGRMDQLKKAELINALKFQVESFEIVRNEANKAGVLVSSIEIDTQKTPIENSDIIMKWIDNNYNKKY